ncbi:Uncharacterized SAM-binding protein YcdF, DUF218 family [Devosia lucknowensis]|uniref:Uncharacterized SAM-binding protein YcdF, DUF218 family n=2 Tax=Devosia lucknowensis TaxID=1096929 RepID=A0A1Y6FBP0_9HYPH|nr:Uncharacterized SAM-binding protein YcdF, DUF218 family [Devosia lucknowensis]
MFFAASKAFWLFAQPVSLVLLLLLAGLAFLILKKRRMAIASLSLAATAQFLVGFTSLGYVLIQPLEDRFEQPSELPTNVGAIVVLGGATMARPSSARGVAELNQAGDRLTTTLWLAQRYPDARVILSGGGGFLMGETESEAETMRRFFTSFGIADDRLMLEGNSMNTDENASFTRAMIDQAEDGARAVLLVTSAFHMPRSIGIFRKQGIAVMPWPTDYRSSGRQGFELDIANPNQNLETATVAVREWIGLLAYHLTGRTDDLFPAQ